MLKSYREKKLKDRLEEELQAYFDRAVAKRKRTNDNYRSFRDYLNKDELKDFSRKAYAHDKLCRKYDGEPSDWFVMRLDLPHEPNSADGIMTVQTNTSSKVEFKREMDGLIYMYRDGVKGEDPVPPASLGVR